MFLTNLSIKKKVTYFLTLILSIPNLVMANCSPAEDKSRIVAAGGSLTEIIFMLGLQNHLVGRDLTSTFPAEAHDLPSIGYVRNLSIEGLLSLDPTLILAEEDAGPSLVINQVERLSVDFRVLEDSLTPYGILDKVRCIGKILKVDDRTLSNVSKKISSSHTFFKLSLKISILFSFQTFLSKLIMFFLKNSKFFLEIPIVLVLLILIDLF